MTDLKLELKLFWGGGFSELDQKYERTTIVLGKD